MRHIFIYGFFFQKKSSFGIGYNETGDEQAMITEGILYKQFSGVMDRKTGNGFLIDTYGDSQILRQKINTHSFIFHKTYLNTPQITIRYNLIKTPEGLYVGTWEARGESGLASLFTSDCPFKEFPLLTDPVYVIEFLKSKGYKHVEIPFVNDLAIIKNLQSITAPSDGFGDDLPF